MSSTPHDPPDPDSPAEARLLDLLDLMRARPPLPPNRLTGDVVTAARFERKVRTAAVSVSHLGAAALESIVVLLGLRQPGR